MRIIVVNDFAKVTGGSDRVALTEAAELAGRGHDVRLLAGHGEPEPGLAQAGVKVRVTGQHTTVGNPNPLRAAAQGIWNRPAERLAREMLADAPDGDTVVHVHGYTKVLSASVAKVAIDSGHPVVLTLHDYFAACPNGGFFNYQTNEICPLVPLSRACVCTHCDIRSYPQKLWRVSRTAVQKHVAALPSGIGHFISPSRATGEILRPYLPQGHLHVIPNPVFGPEPAAVQPAANDAFVFLGRLERDKGPVVLAEAAHRAGVPVVFVGAGQEAEAVRRANPAAELTGWLLPEAAQAQLRAARAVVNASLWYETQGLSVLEAASHGVPAVVSDRTVLKEAVVDGDTGLWFRGGDVGDLAEKLGTLRSSDALVARLGANARHRFKAGSYDLATHLDRLERVYRVALEAAVARW